MLVAGVQPAVLAAVVSRGVTAVRSSSVHYLGPTKSILTRVTKAHLEHSTRRYLRHRWDYAPFAWQNA